MRSLLRWITTSGTRRRCRPSTVSDLRVDAGGPRDRACNNSARRRTLLNLKRRRRRRPGGHAKYLISIEKFLGAKPMKIGIMIAATAESGDISEIAREVENLGYESFFIPEHPVIPVGFKTPLPGGGAGTLPEHYGRWMDPFIALSAAAAVTKRIKLGTGICLLPEREPIITAKTIATLDVISGGRVE